MSSVECLREFVQERLTAAAEEIFGVFRKTIVEYEEEINRQRKLLDTVWKPIQIIRIEPPQQHVRTKEVLADQQLCIQERNSSLDQEDPEPPQIKEEQEELCASQEGEQLVTLVRIELPLQHVCREEEVLADQQLCLKERNSSLDKEDPELPLQHVSKEEEVPADQQLCIQERNSSLDQEDTEPPQIKEEQEELCVSQEGEQLVLKQQETDAFMLTPTYEESDHRELEPKRDHQLLSHSSHIAESQDQTGGTHEESGSTRDAESEPQKRQHESRSHSNNVYNFLRSDFNCNTHRHRQKTFFQCDTCGKTFQCKYCFKTHLRTHTSEKPYTCKTCGRAFSRNGDLTVHMKRAHIGEKPYTCKTGERAFCHNGDLTVHMKRAHTGEKPYTCKTCGRAFSRNGDLTVHMRRAHAGEKPYLCKTCGESFITMFQLKRHSVIHTHKLVYSADLLTYLKHTS